MLKLPLLNIPQSGRKSRKMSKRLGGIIGCKYKTSSWHLNGFPHGVVVVVVFFTLTDRASTIPSNVRGCQSGTTWSRRGTKVNRSHHHGDNPLLRPTGIQIATKSYATLQAMALTNNKTVHQTCEPLSAFRFFCFFVFWCLCVAQKTSTSLLICSLYS